MSIHYKLYLCSNSPRRRELIKAMGFDVEILPLNADEYYPIDLQADEVAEYIARKKADAIDFSQLPDDALCITSDTVVICDEIILGKPKNNEEAIAMLKLLSGKTHKVVSGVCLTCANLSSKKKVSFSDTTFVTFSTLSENTIKHYVENYQVLDKAGAYAIQDWIGMVGIESINGSYYNVMGLPTERLYRYFGETL